MYRAAVFNRMRAALSAIEPRHALTTRDAVKFAMWPLAVMITLQRVFANAVSVGITDDFTPVYKAAFKFLNHEAIYTADFEMVNPHYLYPPGGTLLMAPLAILDPEKSRWLFILANAIAIIIAWYLLLRLFKLTLASVVAPVLLFAMFISETVTNTLYFGNVNGCMLLAEVGFLHLLLARRDLWAGALLGLTMTVKPILIPLLVVAAMRRQWKVFITALGVPVALTAIAWPLSADPMDFVHRTAPYLMASRDYFNSSIVGNSLYYGVPSGLTWLMRVLFAALVVVSLWLLWRYYRENELFFVCTTSGVLFIAMWLIGSLGQQYYSMLVFPFLLTVALSNSTLRNWPAWLAIAGFMSYDKWLIPRFPAIGRDLEYLRVTFGWSLILIVVFCVLGDRYLTAKREGRLAGGIDPVTLKDEAGSTSAAEEHIPSRAQDRAHSA